MNHCNIHILKDLFVEIRADLNLLIYFKYSLYDVVECVVYRAHFLRG